jgi:hypothetical protein
MSEGLGEILQREACNVEQLGRMGNDIMMYLL